jgi:hypothetical protein
MGNNIMLKNLLDQRNVYFYIEYASLNYAACSCNNNGK